MKTNIKTNVSRLNRAGKLRPKRLNSSDPLKSLKIWHSFASVRTVSELTGYSINQVQNHVYGLINNGLLMKHCRGYCFSADRMGVNIYIATAKGVLLNG